MYVVHLYNMGLDTMHFSLEEALEWLESTGRYGEVRRDSQAIVSVVPQGTIWLKAYEEVWR